MADEGEAMTDHDAKMEARDRLRSLDHPRADDIYRHYKGGLYRVVMVGADEDDPRVIRVGYRSLTYRSDQFRTLANFTEAVECDGETTPRFRLVASGPTPTNDSSWWLRRTAELPPDLAGEIMRAIS